MRRLLDHLFRMQVQPVIAEPRCVFGGKHHVSAIVNREHQPRWNDQRRLMVRYVNASATCTGPARMTSVPAGRPA
jgi:hypothetical protein